MKLNTRDFARKCQMPLTLVFATLPIAPIFYAMVSYRLLPFSWVIPALYVIMAFLGITLPGKLRIVYGILCFFVFVRYALLMMDIYGYFHGVLLAVPLFYGVLLFWTLQVANWVWHEELSGLWYCAGISIHVVGQILLYVLEKQEAPFIKPVNAVLLASFFAFVLLALLAMNRDSLATATSGRFRAAYTMRWKNMVLTLVIFLIALAIYLIPFVVTLIETAGLLLVALFFLLLDFLFPMEETTVPEESIVKGSGSGWAPAVEQEPDKLVELLETIVVVVGVAVTLVVLGYLVFQIIKEGGSALLRAMNNIGRYSKDVSMDYEDTITDTREPDGKEDLEKKPVIRRLSRVNERKMEPGERIRYHYGRLLVKHPEWSRGNTARENIKSEAAQYYERARYSGHTVTEDEAARFTERIKKV